MLHAEPETEGESPAPEALLAAPRTFDRGNRPTAVVTCVVCSGHRIPHILTAVIPLA